MWFPPNSSTDSEGSASMCQHQSRMQITSKLLTQDGLLSLVSRGLGTRILISGIQSAVFTVLFKLGQAAYFDTEPQTRARTNAQLDTDAGDKQKGE
jgi:hypothetical protein